MYLYLLLIVVVLLLCSLIPGRGIVLVKGKTPNIPVHTQQLIIMRVVLLIIILITVITSWRVGVGWCLYSPLKQWQICYYCSMKSSLKHTIERTTVDVRVQRRIKQGVLLYSLISDTIQAYQTRRAGAGTITASLTTNRVFSGNNVTSQTT